MKKLVQLVAMFPLVAMATMWYVDGIKGSDDNVEAVLPKETIQAAISTNWGFDVQYSGDANVSMGCRGVSLRPKACGRYVRG